MLMDQVRQLQQKVSQMSQGGSNTGTGSNTGADGSDFAPPFQPRILLVSNIPNSVASCDALFFMFDRLSIR